MPTSDWLAKRADVNPYRELPFRLLRCGKDKRVGDAGAEIPPPEPGFVDARGARTAGCTVAGDSLTRKGATFKQIPYPIGGL